MTHSVAVEAISLPTLLKGRVDHSDRQAVKTVQTSPVAPSFGAAPLSVSIMRNDVLNRGLIDTAGYTPMTVGMGRNFFDGAEKFLDNLIWLLATVLAPVWVDNALSKRASKQLRAQFADYFTTPAAPEALTGTKLHRAVQRLEQLGQDSVLRVPWRWLNGEGLPHTPLPATEANALVKEVGFKSNNALHHFLRNPNARKAVLGAKLGILTLDLAIMGAANLLGAWGKNWFTQTFSGKEGFSGEFGYASDAYRKQQAEAYESHKAKRFAQSVAFVAGVTLLLPPLVAAGALTKGKSAVAQGLQKLSKLMDYHQGIYASKWLVLWGGFFNWLGVYTLAARDKHERREEITRAAVLAPAYIIGDDLLAGVGAKVAQNLGSIKKHGIALAEKGMLGLPGARPIWEVLEQVGHNTAHPVYKAAKANAWGGLLGATALTAAIIPMVNHPTTEKAATREQHQGLLAKFIGLLRTPISQRHNPTDPQYAAQRPLSQSQTSLYHAMRKFNQPFNGMAHHNGEKITRQPLAALPLTAAVASDINLTSEIDTFALATTRFHGSLVQ